MGLQEASSRGAFEPDDDCSRPSAGKGSKNKKKECNDIRTVLESSVLDEIEFPEEPVMKSTPHKSRPSNYKRKTFFY